jgi:hypothetical protein
MPTRIVLLWCLLVISTFPVRGQTVDQPNSAQTTEPKATLSIDPAKQADIRRLIELTGGKKNRLPIHGHDGEHHQTLRD